jgi:hypothetical protein
MLKISKFHQLDILDCAYLSQDAYINLKDAKYNRKGYYLPNARYLVAKGWVGLPMQNEHDSMSEYKNLIKSDDFFARLYVNLNTHETVVAYRGTVIPSNSAIPLRGDAIADIELTTGIPSLQNGDANSKLGRKKLGHFVYAKGWR